MRTKAYFTRAEADLIIALIKEKLKADTVKQKGIRAKIRRIGFWADDFGLGGGYTVADFLRFAKIEGNVSIPPSKQASTIKPAKEQPNQDKPLSGKRNHSDETYFIDLCDEVLQKKALRQHRFDFLKGDSGARLPVDAYYPELHLVIEYCEKQHTEEVKFFDKRKTVSGMSRGEQRKLYDQRRREVLPQHGIKLIELGYNDFDHTRNKQLVRNKEKDISVVKENLKK